jgi:hypothetical protein
VSKIQLFLDSLTTWLTAIAEVFNQHGVPRLMRINGFDVAKAPSINFQSPSNIDIAALGTFIQQLAGAGAPLFPDEDLEGYLRQAAGLPRPMAEEV